MTDKVIISDDESNDGIDECSRDLTSDLNGGVLKQILQGGKYKGKIYKDLGDDILIHLVGTLKKENKVFYNTRKLNKPIRTKLSSNMFGRDVKDKNSTLPPALEIAIPTMKKHEIALITCKPEYGYGNKPYKQKDFICEVPANSEVVFEVELLDFRFCDLTNDKNSGVLFCRTFKKGKGNFYPIYNSEVCCDISSYDDFKYTRTCWGSAQADHDIDWIYGMKDDKYYEDEFNITDCQEEEVDQNYLNIQKTFNRKDSKINVDDNLTLGRKSKDFLELRDFTWTLGEGALHRIPKGVEIAIENMVVGDHSMFKIRYDYFKDMINEDEYKEAEEYSDFYHFIIHLKSCKKAKEYYEMTGEERIKEGLECKLKGNYYLTEKQNVRLALKRFKRAIDLLETSIDLDGENNERDQLLFTCYLNISKAYFDAKTPELSTSYLNKALEMKPTNEKALYRYGQLLIERKMFKEAKEQFDKLLKIYPTNKAAQTLSKKCEGKIREQSDTEKVLYKKMFKGLVL